MAEHDLFIELFPIEWNQAPQLTAYYLEFDAPPADIEAIGRKLAYRLNRAFSGQWVWADDHILTNDPVLPMQMEMELDSLRQSVPDIYGQLKRVEKDDGWSLTPRAMTMYLAQTVLHRAADDMRSILSDKGARIPNGYIMREPLVSTWVTDRKPALSLSIRSHLFHDRNLQQYITQDTPDDIIGLRVMDRTEASIIGSIRAQNGTLGDHRERLLELTRREGMSRFLKQAPDDDVIVTVDTGEYDYDYPASALRILIAPERLQDLVRFRIDREKAERAMHLRPDVRASFISLVSDVLKKKGIIGNAYNSRTDPAFFGSLDAIPAVTFGNDRTRSYDVETVYTHFASSGVYHKHDRFADTPIKMALINTLNDAAVSDFIEALRRAIERDYGFEFEIIRERNVRVVNEANIASAVRTVEKEDPHIIIALFAAAENHDMDYARYLKSLTLARGIATQVIDEPTMHNPNKMSHLIMSLLAKTGNTPYALAEPLSVADLVVGFDLVREQLSWGDRLVAMSRIYRKDGSFVRYHIHDMELDTDEPMPYVVLQKIFPEDLFLGRHSILHHAGMLPMDIIHKIQRWGEVVDGQFFPVEILCEHVPRLYALKESIAKPPWGSIFRLSDYEAFAVSSMPAQDITPRPLHIRVPDESLPVEEAVYSVLAWTLLHYGTYDAPTIPVTIQSADEIAQWMARGSLPEKQTNDIPFWL